LLSRELLELVEGDPDRKKIRKGARAIVKKTTEGI
jgi:hypothetical protein